MKKYNLIFILALIAIVFQSCREDESINKGQVQFAFNASSLTSPGGRVSDLPDGATLIVSITKSNGDPVHTLKELNLIKFGDQYISDPLALLPGEYLISDFMIASGSEVLYATPKEGAPLADLVEHPLPIAFSVMQDEITDLPVEVVSVESNEPEEFGYVSFNITIRPVEVFKLSVFVQENGALKFTGAQAYLILDGDTIYNNYLLPQPNSIRIDDSYDLDETYTLVVIEPSYKKHSQTFTLTELYETLGAGTPVAVVLTPALTFTTIADATADPNIFDFSRSMRITGPTLASTGTLNIDWGDGTLEDIQIPFSDSGYPLHAYATPGPHFVSISGDLEVIDDLSLFYGNAITEISLTHLSGLRQFGMGASLTPATVDFSHNKKLEWLNLSMSTFTHFDVSQNTALKDVDLFMNDFFTSESLNKMIHDLLQNASVNNTRDGLINIYGYEKPLVGPPSEAAKEELRTLRDDFGWTIYPEEF